MTILIFLLGAVFGIVALVLASLWIMDEVTREEAKTAPPNQPTSPLLKPINHQENQ